MNRARSLPPLVRLRRRHPWLSLLLAMGLPVLWLLAALALPS